MEIQAAETETKFVILVDLTGIPVGCVRFDNQRDFKRYLRRLRLRLRTQMSA